MKNMLKSNKAFSLIELIVVIAVIAAIAVVIVPRVTNFSDAAAAAADQRNVQLWNSTYQQIVASNAVQTGVPADATAYAVGATVPGISGQLTINGDTITFAADGFIVQDVALTFDDELGLQ